MPSHDHIITAKLYGGIGNQLFQIAIAYANSLKYNTQFILVEPDNFECGQGNHPSKYMDSIYKKIKFVKNLDTSYVFKEHVWGHLYTFDDIPSIMSKDGQQVIQFDGYFQSEKNFYEYSPLIKKLFTPDEGIIAFLEKTSDIFSHFPELKEPSEDRCFIGVRRGDYVERWNVHNPCGMIYFNKAIEMMNSSDGKKVYYISSDDYTWARKHFVGDNFKFLDIGSDIIQLYTGCLFKNYIISNSTFHWWTSFLSIYDSVRVIAPDKWITLGPRIYTFGSNIYREDMEIVERPVETV